MGLQDYTPLQIEACRTHLAAYYEADVDAGLERLNPSQQLLLLGDISTPTIENSVYLEGEAIASKSSVLGRVLLAHQKLTPDTIDDSLLVVSVGKVNLRRDELRARTRLYKQLLTELARLLGFGTLDSTHTRRIGYTSI